MKLEPKLKILMLATSYYPTIGGLENYMRGLALRLAERGHKITIQTIKVPGANCYECFENMEIKRTKVPNMPGTKQLFWFFIVLKAIYKTQKDIDIVHAFPLFMTGVFSSIIGKIINKPVVIREGMSTALLDKTLNVPITPTLARYAIKNSTTYVNNLETINLFERFGILTNDLQIIRTPVDTNIFKPVENKEMKKRDMGINSKFTLLYVGRFIGWKNVDLLIRAMPKLVSLIPNINLILVGDGRDKSKLVRLAKELNVSNHITFTGFIPQDEVHNYFQVADIFGTLATHATKGKTYLHPDTTIYQAMACGIPIVSPPDMQGLSDKECPQVSNLEIIDTGVIINKNEIENFISAVVYLYENPNNSRILGEQGRRIAIKELTWDRHIEKIEQIYSKKFDGD